MTFAKEFLLRHSPSPKNVIFEKKLNLIPDVNVV